MKKILLRTGVITIGTLSIFSDNYLLMANAKIPQKIISIENNHQKLHGEDLIRKYANIYEIDEEIIISKMTEITSNFKNYNWLQNYGIYDNSYENEEIAILTTIRDIYKHSENYNLKKEDLQTNKKYEVNKICEELVAYYCELLSVKKEIAMSIIYAECGKELNSSNYLNNNNPAGMGPHNYYNNIEHGIIEFVFLLKNSYNCNLETDSTFFFDIGKTYCPEGYDNWIENTIGCYNNLIEDYYCYVNNKKYQKKLY